MAADVSADSWFALNIPQDAWQVQDADEETFLLYSQLQSSANSVPNDEDGDVSGLGSVNSRQGELPVRIAVKTAPRQDCATPSSNSHPSHSHASKRGKGISSKRSHMEQEYVEAQLFQDTTALRSRKGDTGSVLWRASVHLARLLLSQIHADHPLLSADYLSTSHVIELGAGTGLLSILLAPYVAHYTATDLPSLLPLIRKNQIHNLVPLLLAKVSIDDLDWIQLQNTPAHLRNKNFLTRKAQEPSLQHHDGKGATSRRIISLGQASLSERRFDLILVVDCVYNPSLIAPLLSTIEYLTTPSSHLPLETDSNQRIFISPMVLVVLELRAADVTRDFIDGWLTLPGDWEIWNIPLLDKRFVMWVGRQRIDLTST
ncbi:hypothetical protein K439DRAFT_1652164 [Ramaria rubella]|nr:hypothetical protein K439DRAFT_1652164 [Ramaria rubella]